VNSYDEKSWDIFTQTLFLESLSTLACASGGTIVFRTISDFYKSYLFQSLSMVDLAKGELIFGYKDHFEKLLVFLMFFATTMPVLIVLTSIDPIVLLNIYVVVNSFVQMSLYVANVVTNNMIRTQISKYLILSALSATASHTSTSIHWPNPCIEKWHGLACSCNTTLCHVTILEFQFDNLVGTLPDTNGELTEVTFRCSSVYIFYWQ